MSPTEPPQTIEQKCRRAVEYHQAGRLREAERLYRMVLADSPREAVANHNLGLMLLQEGRPQVAIPLFKVAIEVNPAEGQYWLSFIDALVAIGELASARLMLDAARGRGLCGDGLEQRDAQIRQLTEASGAPLADAEPTKAERDYMATLWSSGLYNEVEAEARRMTERNPRHYLGWKLLGLVLAKCGRAYEATAFLQMALSLKPDEPETLTYMGAVHEICGKYEDALRYSARAAEFNPKSAEAFNGMGNAQKALGRMEEAEAHYAKALELKPDAGSIYSNLLFLGGLRCSKGPHAYLDLARGWEQSCVPAADRAAAAAKTVTRSPLAGRRLRVGYISGDFRMHAISQFVERLFGYHDRERVEVFAYSTHPLCDAVTLRLQALAEHWMSVAAMPDGEVAERIDSDGIDVLIDLSGHTAQNGLGVIARRAAPVQAHYLGFFASTGLTEMDYWIGDAVLTPPDLGWQFSERIWPLSRTWVSYSPLRPAPETAWRPDPDGHIWIGGFNSLGKVTPETQALWARLLHEMPQARLLIKARELLALSNRTKVLDAFAALGVNPDRIVLHDQNATPDWESHMAMYDRLDIALDPIGAMGGGTTTCDALWMGAPMVTLAGNRMATRMSASLVDAIGRPEWIAESEDEYVAKVVALAYDVDHRRAIRPLQRQRMAESPLCDARGLARSLEESYHSMFERWADGRAR
jgi:predicted O-linked N-acetylglucosamine transferase (SPINDLY family)